jgi:hypothetical protein
VSPLDLAFVVGPLTAPVAGTLALVAAVAADTPKWTSWLAIPIFGLTTGSWLAYWFLWGTAFDRVDQGADLGAIVEVAMNAASWSCAAGCVALVVTAVSARWSARRDLD